MIPVPTRIWGADETCDGADNDCDGTVDENDAVDALIWYIDYDGDGYGSDGFSMSVVHSQLPMSPIPMIAMTPMRAYISPKMRSVMV